MVEKIKKHILKLDTKTDVQKKTNLAKSVFYEVKSGDAENRTRVQTSSSKAFYILSFCLIFGM
ncbi:protein of unknown function [Tenacibaculum maritimum NCIMB 2154]|uniref:Uncharacterized protein n=1 Tax=Tenacibaculum maritimum NCIMB 2154 TaxID=1349785 RepID=A0A2H1ECP7_9FLAO|nr:protein of unknown function [Tenacibaculum maritimum NCIMB 2154]